MRCIECEDCENPAVFKMRKKGKKSISSCRQCGYKRLTAGWQVVPTRKHCDHANTGTLYFHDEEFNIEVGAVEFCFQCSVPLAVSCGECDELYTDEHARVFAGMRCGACSYA